MSVADYKYSFGRFILMFVSGAYLLGFSFSADALADTYTLSAEQWARPRSGDLVARLPAVRQLVESWMQTENALIEIRYPGGEPGDLWASELRDWLVALGIPSDVIIIEAGSPSGDKLLIQSIELNRARQ